MPPQMPTPAPPHMDTPSFVQLFREAIRTTTPIPNQVRSQLRIAKSKKKKKRKKRLIQEFCDLTSSRKMDRTPFMKLARGGNDRGILKYPSNLAPSSSGSGAVKTKNPGFHKRRRPDKNCR